MTIDVFEIMLEAETATLSPPGQARGLPDRLRNWSGRMGGSLTAMVDNLTKGTCCYPDLHSHDALLCCAAMPCACLLCCCILLPGRATCLAAAFAVLFHLCMLCFLCRDGQA